jgi:pyrroline-5-carboxylate reductase
MEGKVLEKTRIAIIGGGAMGRAIIHTLTGSGEIDPGNVVASDPVPEQRELLLERYGVRVSADNVEAVKNADVVVIAVKPQVLPHVMTELKGSIPQNALVFSIVAGMPIKTMRLGFDHEAIIRAMPNTPAQIGEGMTVWTASPAVTESHLAQARTILSAMGKELYVDEEGELDMATAVSGTGPTYVFLLMEALVDAAVHLGFSRRDARDLVIQTVEGSVKYAAQSDQHLARMRNMVTSPGGTSAEAIYQLEKGGMRTVLSKAVWAAYQKSRLLGERAEEPLEAPLRVDSEG